MTVNSVLVIHKECGIIQDDTRTFVTLSKAKEYFEEYIENYFDGGFGTEEKKNYCLQVGNFSTDKTDVIILTTEVE